MLAALAELPDHRPARPGEFTRRAFANRKLDLTQAEAIADLIQAETEAQRRQALRQLDGELREQYDRWKNDLIRALAHLEALIDFPEEDLPATTLEALRASLDQLERSIGQHLDDNRRGERLRSGFTIAILGPPNVGKSSLINAIAKRDIAITAPTPGTTRDTLEAHLDIDGFPVTVVDTAGIRDSADTVEQEGVRRAFGRAETADLKVLVLDATVEAAAPTALSPLVDRNTIVVLNKIDLLAAPVGASGSPSRRISVRTGEGMSELIALLGRSIAERYGLREAPTLTRARHRLALQAARSAVSRACAGLAERAALPELPAEDLRLAARHLGEITGEVGIEDVLDIVFKDFCIGK
jgi:tRNA modification GTPase